MSLRFCAVNGEDVKWENSYTPFSLRRAELKRSEVRLAAASPSNSGRGEWSKLGSRDIDQTNRGASVREGMRTNQSVSGGEGRRGERDGEKVLRNGFFHGFEGESVGRRSGEWATFSSKAANLGSSKSGESHG